jgi:hypothetical protein
MSFFLSIEARAEGLMPFLLYNLEGPPGREQYTGPRPCQLAGRKGPFAHLVAVQNPEKQVPFGWHATAEELIAYQGGSPSARAIVLDLKPNAPDEVSLYRLLDVWGYSYHDWTALAVRLQALVTDRREPNPARFKKGFVDGADNHRLAGEFLYVYGGVTGGHWNWGKVGHVNGVLLWKDAFDFLSAGLSKGL